MQLSEQELVARALENISPDVLAGDQISAWDIVKESMRVFLNALAEHNRAQADARPAFYAADDLELPIQNSNGSCRIFVSNEPFAGCSQAFYTHPEASAPGLSDDAITDVWIKHGGPLNGNNFHSFARAILTSASAATVAEPSDSAKIIDALWSIIDDIDTYDDAAKGDDALYRKLVRARQKDRWKTGITTDGYGLKMPQAAQQQAEPHTSQAHPTFQTVSVPNGPGTPSAQTFDRRIACKPGQPEWKSCKQQAEPSKLEEPAQVGNTIFCKGVETRLVIEAAQRNYQRLHNPTEEDKRIAAGVESLTQLRKQIEAEHDAKSPFQREVEKMGKKTEPRHD